MSIVVADSSPLNILVRIERHALLPRLFDRVLVPPEVVAELSREATPSAVRDWAAAFPEWIEVSAVPGSASASELGDGEEAAIRLALAVRTLDILMDDKQAHAVARRAGLRPLGAAGLLALAYDHGLTNLREDLARLRETDFRVSRTVLDALLIRRNLPPL